MSAMLIRGAEAVLTGQRSRAARAGAVDLRIRDGVIAEIAAGLAVQPGERVIDASGCVVYPAWVNTHHHLAQTVMKATPEGLDLPLRDWLREVPSRYRRFLDAATLRIAARVGIVELMLSGCATVADHNYIHYPGMPFDSSAILFEEAERLGVRFVLCRGGMTRAQPGYEGDTPAYLRPEPLEAMLADVERLTARYHDPSPRARRRVVMAPTTPAHRVHPQELVEIARTARRLGIRLHTHLSENIDYLTYFRETHRRTPVEFCAEHEWLGADVWFAHLCHVTETEIRLMAEAGTGLAHCPGSNARLGSGVAPAPAMAAAGMPVSLAVDGAASNEPGDFLTEAHAAWYVHRAAKGATGLEHGGADAVTIEEVVHWGTMGGGRVLGLDVGELAVGKSADIAVYALDDPRCFGFHDVAVAPVAIGGGVRVKWLFSAGRAIVADGAIPGIDLFELRAQTRAAVNRLRQAHA
jgi:cytosine/adenosine deaminase-related metal-dependent hydrolase